MLWPFSVAVALLVAAWPTDLVKMVHRLFSPTEEIIIRWWDLRLVQKLTHDAVFDKTKNITIFYCNDY